jgi:hypothetical protein
MDPVLIPPAATVGARLRYGLMNDRGQYFVHPYRYADTWLEWDYSAHDAHEWVDRSACEAAAKVWQATHGETLTVIAL